MGCFGTKAESPAAKPAASNHKVVNVLGKYEMYMDKKDHMGEGTSSICRRGKNTSTGEYVAIKVYKESSSKSSRVTLQKFRRQIKVLQELQEPFQRPSDDKLWHPLLDSVHPSQVFMRLIDYSKDRHGEPGPDPTDKTMYVITELAQYSLKDHLATLRAKKRTQKETPLPKDKMKRYCKAICVAMAGLHAKGYVHIDMKPENMMMFNGKLKVIDVDGCVKSGSKINISDSSISFSPCYCAPEWARFLISESESDILALPALDVWSVGMTLCELVTFDAILKPQYGNFLRNAHSHREAGFLFLEWLGGIEKAPLPKAISGYDDREFKDLIKWLLVCKKDERRSCAECLSHPFLMDVDWEIEAPQVEHQTKYKRQLDETTGEKLVKGVLFKLNSNGDPNSQADWIRRDMWIAAENNSLCYFSQKENRKLVLIDGSRLAKASLEKMEAARPFAFRCTVSDDREIHDFGLSAESQEEMDNWMKHLTGFGRNQMLITFELGAQLAQDLQKFRITVQNRRQKVNDENKKEFEAMFKAKLWKLKGDGDCMKEGDWFEREMWMAKNGSLVYFSPKDDTDLVYYSANDVARAAVTAVEDGKACKPFAFQVQLPPTNGVEFAPGEFAAESEELRKQWMSELTKHSHKS